MQIFRSLRDINKLEPYHPAYGIIKRCLIRSGNLEGFIVLVEPSDLKEQAPLPGLDCQLHEVNWEGVSMLDDSYAQAILLRSNEMAIQYVIKMDEGLDSRLLKALEDNLINHK